MQVRRSMHLMLEGKDLLRDMRNEGTRHGTLEKELMVQGKPVKFGKEMEVLHWAVSFVGQ